MNITPADKAALEIGRLFMRAHAAEQQVALLQARLAEFESKNKEPETAREQATS
jgi:hypothetical protein